MILYGVSIVIHMSVPFCIIIYYIYSPIHLYRAKHIWSIGIHYLMQLDDHQ